MKTVINIFLLFAVLVGFQSQASAQTIDIRQAHIFARQFLDSQNNSQNTIADSKTLFNNEDAPASAYLFSLAPKGFIIVSSTCKDAPILAYSLEHNFVSENNFEAEICLSLIKEIAYNDLYVTAQDSTARDAHEANVLYGPYVHTMWGQVNCRDIDGKLINVNNIYTPNHYAPGCVAVSQATIMHHYTWPPKGVGSMTYTDNSGSSTGTYSANFGDTEYKWAETLERYRSKSSTIEEREAAGEITYHCSVSLKMDFESNGSTSNVNRIPSALAQHFRFTALYRSRSSSTFFSLIDSNMVYKKPVVLAVENNSGGGHSVVCDGLKIEDGVYFYHLNMGWWGASNGWYKIRGSFNAGGYTSIVGAAMNILPEPMIEQPVLWSDSIEFDLKWSYPEKAEAEAFEVQKKVDGGSWVTISDASTDTSIHMVADPEKEYKFRVRAKTNGKWYQNSWSTVTELKRKYVGIVNNPLQNVTFYPNPFSNQLTLDFSQQYFSSIEIAIFDVTGKLLETRNNHAEHSIVINTDHWNKGLYFIRISNDNNIYTVKVIKN